MHIDALKELLGEAFVENVILAAPNQDQIKETLSLIYDAHHKFGDRSLAFSLRYNLIRILVSQSIKASDELTGDVLQERRVAMSLGVVKMLKASDELSDLYYNALMKQLADCPTRWEMIWMLPEPVAAVVVDEPA